MTPKKRDHALPCVGMEFESLDDAYHLLVIWDLVLELKIHIKVENAMKNVGQFLVAIMKVLKSSQERLGRRSGCRAMLKIKLVESPKWKSSLITIMCQLHQVLHFIDGTKDWIMR